MKNYGFITPEYNEEDYVFGASELKGQVLVEDSDWRKYLPLFERQRKSFDTKGCVAFGTLSALEMIHKRKYGIEPNYSDRYTAVTSETTPTGNTPKKVAHTIRKKGTVPEVLLPFSDSMNRKEYFKDIPNNLLQLGAEWLDDYIVNYEWVRGGTKELKKALKLSPVCVSVYAWSRQGGVYVNAGAPNHWTTLVAYEGENPIVWDSYEEKLKKLSPDYTFSFAMRYELTKGKREQMNVFETLMRYGLLSFFADWWKEFTKVAKVVVPEAKPTLYSNAVKAIGKDISKTENELGCAESVAFLINQTYGDFKITTATRVLYRMLRKDPRFELVLEAEKGTIILSPTGTGSGIIKFGHTGIFGEDEKIMSNDSYSFKWEQNYTLKSWISRYRDKGKYKIFYFKFIN